MIKTQFCTCSGGETGCDHAEWCPEYVDPDYSDGQAAEDQESRYLSGEYEE